MHLSSLAKQRVSTGRRDGASFVLRVAPADTDSSLLLFDRDRHERLLICLVKGRALLHTPFGSPFFLFLDIFVRYYLSLWSSASCSMIFALVSDIFR